MQQDVRSVPGTPTVTKNIFTRAFNSLFGHSDETSLNTALNTPKPSTIDQFSSSYQDIASNSNIDGAPLNQSTRIFNLETPKSVNWDLDSDEELNETIHRIQNLPGTYPERFPSPYIPRNYKPDQDLIHDRQLLNKYLSQASETNTFLQELLLHQQYTKNDQQDSQSIQFANLKKQYAAELETSKQVYDGFRRLLFKYKTLKEQLKQLESQNNVPTVDQNSIQLELQSTKRALISKSKRIQELEKDVKRLTDQRDDLKTTILEYKNQNLRLKTSNELLAKENATFSDSNDSISSLRKKNDMLQIQITNTNEMFKSQSEKLKNQIFDLEQELKKSNEAHDFEVYSKDRRIKELEDLLATKQSGALSPLKFKPSDNIPKQRYRSQILKDENLSVSDISAILNEKSEDLTGFDNDRVTKRLSKPKHSDLSDIFNTSI